MRKSQNVYRGENPTSKMNKKFNNVIGLKSERLTVIKELPNRKSGKYSKRFVLCKCTCGNEKAIRLEDLVRQNDPTKSCGCLRKEKIIESVKTHGMAGSKTYKTWSGIKDRCYNPKCDYYYCYGGKGIKVSDEWRKSFETFFKDMGEAPPGYSIERLDINKDYCKENCKWIPLNEQSRNTSCTKLNNLIVKEMREMYKSGMSGTKVAKLYKEKHPNISYSAIERAVYGKTWQ